jgi:tellurite resistance protein TerC
LINVDVFLWILFFVTVGSALAFDLLIVNRKAHVVSVREATKWIIAWVSLALLFDLVIYFLKGPHKALEFLTGYIVEYSLSVDNVFVFLMIFAHFHVPPIYQPRVLKWGILGAVVMRAFFVVVGVTLLNMFHWMVYIFGGLLIYAAIKMLVHKEEEFHPEKNLALRLFKFIMPVSHELKNEHFFVRGEMGRLMAARLFIVLILVETSDLIFALDSVPAVIAISRDLFIVYSSNIFAILGLRSLFFVLAGVMELFHFLKYGLCVILTFVGVKLMISSFYHVPTGWALGFIAAILAISVLASLVFKKKVPEQKVPENVATH